MSWITVPAPTRLLATDPLSDGTFRQRHGAPDRPHERTFRQMHVGALPVQHFPEVVAV